MSDARFPSVATDDFRHLRGEEARSNNIAAARGVAETVRSTLGPTGLDKMLVSSNSSVTVTNDGETVLKEMDVDHPAARVIVEVAKSQAEQVGDGTTTAVLLAGELLQAADRLLDQGTHPTAVIDGYQRAIDRLVDELDELAHPEDPDDELLRRVAESSLTGKAVAPHARELAGLVLDASAAVTVEDTVDIAYLEIRSRAGATVVDSELRHGAVLNGEPCHESMVTELPDATVLLLQRDFEVPEPETELRAEIDSAERREGFLDREDRRMIEAVDHVADLGVNAVLCHGRVNDRGAALLATRGILAIEHVKREETDFDFLQEVTGATAISDPLDARREHLGRADVSRDGPFFVENEGTHGVTLVLRGSTDHVAAEVERSVSDAIDVVTRTIYDHRVIPGGGAPEIELAARLREHAAGVDGRAQLAVDAFADALEAVPRTLAKNAGLDPIDTLVDLRSAHAAGHTHAGLNVVTGQVEDALDAGIVQPAYILEQSVYNAGKAASILLKVDEVISAADLSNFDEESD